MAEKMTLEERIQHFLTLAQDDGATPSERDLAAAQAERLMIKHAISPEQIDAATIREEKIVKQELFFRSPFRKVEANGMMSIANALNLRTFYISYTRGTYSQENGHWVHNAKPALGVTFIGYESDVEMAVRMANSVFVQSTVALKQWWKTTGRHGLMTYENPSVVKRSFVQGFFQGASRRIRDERKVAISEIPDSGALVLVDRRNKVDAWVDSQYKFGHGRGGNMQSSATGRTAGYVEGLNANVGSRGLGQGRALGR
jgi:hypothetical protein